MLKTTLNMVMGNGEVTFSRTFKNVEEVDQLVSALFKIRENLEKAPGSNQIKAEFPDHEPNAEGHHE